MTQNSSCRKRHINLGTRGDRSVGSNVPGLPDVGRVRKDHLLAPHELATTRTPTLLGRVNDRDLATSHFLSVDVQSNLPPQYRSQSVVALWLMKESNNTQFVVPTSQI